MTHEVLEVHARVGTSPALLAPMENLLARRHAIRGEKYQREREQTELTATEQAATLELVDALATEVKAAERAYASELSQFESELKASNGEASPKSLYVVS